jgi:hypothetical protein
MDVRMKQDRCGTAEVIVKWLGLKCSRWVTTDSIPLIKKSYKTSPVYKYYRTLTLEEKQEKPELKQI